MMTETKQVFCKDCKHVQRGPTGYPPPAANCLLSPQLPHPVTGEPRYWCAEVINKNLDCPKFEPKEST